MKIGLPGNEDSHNQWNRDYVAFAKTRGNGENLLRTERVAQPRALKHGDLLANGYAVVGEPRIGYNSSVLICITKGMHDVRWLELPARISLALAFETKEKDARSYALPGDLIKGDILADGDEVLLDPGWCIDETVMLCLTGGMNGHTIQVPDNIPIALLIKEDNPPVEISNWAQEWREKVGYTK